MAELLCSIQLYFAADLNQPVTSYHAGVTLVVPDKFVKFGEPCLKRSGENRPEAIGGGIFESFSR